MAINYLYVNRADRDVSRRARSLTRGYYLCGSTLAVALIVGLSGCGVVSRGLLYTDTVQPLCRDLRATDLGGKVGAGSSKRVEIPTTQIDLSAEWDSRAIGDIARKHGISVVHGCDSRRQSYVLGIWRRDEVIIYGE
jgi:hypothetical protein